MGEVDEELEELLEEEELEEAPEPEPAVKSFDQVVDEVSKGLWGKGQERRLALAQAGYDHVEVQKVLVERANRR